MEVVVTGSDAASAASFLSVTEIATGIHVSSFKQSASGRKSIAQVNGALLVCQNDKAVVNVYRWHKEGIDQKLIVPEKLDVVTTSHDGLFLLGGSSSGKIYLWEVSSGTLLFVKDAHYQEVTSVVFAEDDLTFVTGAADATVHVWHMPDVLDSSTSQASKKPVYTLSSHTLRVTDLFIGTGNSANARLYTASLDQTIRVYDLATGQELVTLLLPTPVTCIAVDSAERHLFAGTESGTIQEVRMYKTERTVQVIGSSGGIVTVGQSDDTGLHGHEAAITALSLSLDGATLCSGAADGNTFIWDVATRSMQRRLKQQPSAVTLLHIAILPAEKPDVKRTSDQIQPLKRVQVDTGLEHHEVHVKLTQNKSSQFQPITDAQAALVGLAQLTRPIVSDPAAQKTISKLQNELDQLQAAHHALTVNYEHLEKQYINSQI